MIKNKLKQIWAGGQPTVNGWLSIGNPFTAEIMAAQGYDSLSIDLQHGALDYSMLLPMFQAMRASGVVPMARVPWLEPGIVMKVLDAGAYGVICPMVNTPEQAAQFVSYLRYPPAGQRSFGPTRANFSAGANYAAEANDEILAFAMVETAEGLADVEAIVATPGLDGVYIGPSDLSLALGGPPGQDQEAPRLLEAFDTIQAACRAAGVRVGVHTSSVGYSQKMIARGFDLVSVGSDVRYLMGGRREAAEMRAWLDSR